MSDTSNTSDSFLRFADECSYASPLYSRLSRRIAYDGELLDLAAEAASTPVTNLLFGAVHSLLLGGTEHELAKFYPSISEEVKRGDAFPAFRDFCLSHRGEIAHILKTRRVQTNEVRRSALLLPVFAGIHAEVSIPLALVEVGASAGLNLLFDRYAYDYGRFGKVGTSELELRCEVRSETFPVPAGMPEVSMRLGLDLSPINIINEVDTRWLFALIWPEEFGARSELLRDAVRISRQNPPELIPGDATETLPAALENIPDGKHPVVFHTFTVNQFPEKASRKLADIIADFSARHGALDELFVGWRPGETFARIELTKHPAGTVEHLAYCDAHGAWVEWLGQPF